jgi:hypothetical protein
VRLVEPLEMLGADAGQHVRVRVVLPVLNGRSIPRLLNTGNYPATGNSVSTALVGTHVFRLTAAAPHP